MQVAPNFLQERQTAGVLSVYDQSAPELTQPIKTMLAGREAVKQQRWRKDREDEELAGVLAKADRDLIDATEAKVKAIEQEHACELAAIDAEERASKPSLLEGPTEIGYPQRLQRIAIDEMRAQRRATLAQITVSALPSMAPDDIHAVASEAMAAGDVDVAVAVLRAAVGALKTQAGAETRSDAVDRPAFAALMQLQDDERRWRAQTAQLTAAGRRLDVQRRAEARITEARSLAQQIGSKFDLPSAKAAAVAAKRRSESGVQGLAFEAMSASLIQGASRAAAAAATSQE